MKSIPVYAVILQALTTSFALEKSFLAGWSSALKTGDFSARAILFFLGGAMIGAGLILKYLKPKKGGKVEKAPWVQRGEINHAEVTWKVYAPAFLSHEAPDGASLYELEVGLLPYCPQCHAGLKEKKSFKNGYRWQCPKCGFAKINPVSCNLEAEKAAMSARCQFEARLKSS